MVHRISSMWNGEHICSWPNLVAKSCEMQCLLRMSCQKKIIRRRIHHFLTTLQSSQWSSCFQLISMNHVSQGCRLQAVQRFPLLKNSSFFWSEWKNTKKQRFYSSFKQPLCYVKSEICRLQWYLQTSLLLSSDFPLFHPVLDPSHLAWCGKKSSHGPP